MEVRVLRGFGREAHLRRKWNRLWIEIGERIRRLPVREQNILLEDFNLLDKVKKNTIQPPSSQYFSVQQRNNQFLLLPTVYKT